MQLALIAAVARNGVIGAGNRLPWRLPADMRHFRALTLGHAVIMGRKTWDSLPGALAGRQNIVVSRQERLAIAGVEVAPSLQEAMARVSRPPPACCIGGGEIFRIALPMATIVHLTEIDRDFDGEATFPRLDTRQWKETARKAHPGEGPEGCDFAFVTYERRAER